MIKENQRRVVDRGGIESVLVTNRKYQVDAAPELLWDYSQAAEGDRPALQAAARDIKRTARQSVRVIGAALADAKARLPHGLWGEWLETEFDWSDRTAQRIMSATEAVAKNDKLSDLGASALYLTAAAPEDAQAEIGGMAASGGGTGAGGRVTVEDVRRVVRRYTGADAPDAAPPSGSAGGRSRSAPSPGAGRATYTGSGSPAAAAGKCTVCGRTLSDPASVGRACGPTCATKAAAAGGVDGGASEWAGGHPAPVLAGDTVAVWLAQDVAERLYNAADSGAGGLALLPVADVRALAQALRAALGW